MSRRGEVGAAGPGSHRRPSGAASLTVDAAPASDFARIDEPAALRSAVWTRAVEGLRRIIGTVSREHLYQSLTTQTPVDTLIHLMSAGAAVVQAATVVDDPLRAAKARAARRMADLLAAEGGPIGVAEVAALLRITRVAVDKRRRTGTLIGVADGGRAVLYPGWQFRSTGLLPHLDDVLRAMTVRDPWMRIEFFVSPDPELGERPLDALRRGRMREVMDAAKRYGRQGDDG